MKQTNSAVLEYSHWKHRLNTLIVTFQTSNDTLIVIATQVQRRKSSAFSITAQKKDYASKIA